ncbi:hypothetical protein M9Y10_016672 [Tritrichomonas musculus]|uniref:Uncharacterized protein n=1 Tax=Tritrichomonas musculus TaxID=1915356 RepID=A0ABR2HWV1_9EUKA
MSLKLSNNTIKIGIIDLEGCFNLIEKGLSTEGSFQISPKLEFRPDKGAPFFKPYFIQQARPGLKSPSTSKSNVTENNAAETEQSEESDVVLTIFIIGFNPQFTEYDIYSITTWKKQNPDKPFITLIMNKPQTTWVAITSSRSKIEKKFTKRIPDAKCIVIKYNTNEPIKENYISASDFQNLHTSLESAFSLIFEERINELLHTKLNDENYISVYSELSGLLLSLGYNSAAFTFASKIKDARYTVFWPKKPEFYDIQKEIIEKYDTGFDILCSGISQTFAASKQSPYLYNKFGEELSISIARILFNTPTGSSKNFDDSQQNEQSENDKTDAEKSTEQDVIFFFDEIPDPSKKFMITFARNFIHFTASSFCDIVETINEPLCATFALISLAQSICIFRLHNNFKKPPQAGKDPKDNIDGIYNESEFLSNLPTERQDKVNCEQLLLSSWGRARKVFTEWPNNQKYFDSIFFNYLTAKDDKEGALRVFNESDSLKIKNDEFFNYFESHVLLQLFEWKRSDKNLAVNIISSKVPRKVKFEAIKLLDTAYPVFPVNAKFRCPQLFKPLELFEKASFRIQFKVLDFLISNKNSSENDKEDEFEPKVDVYVIFETSNGEKKLKSEPVTTVFHEDNYILNSTVECIYSGTFSKITLCIQYDKTTLCWKLPMMQPLIVNEYNFTPEIVVKSPFLLSQSGDEVQATVVLIENLDTECVEVGITLSLEAKSKTNNNSPSDEENKNDLGIYKIECEGQTFTGKDMFNELVFKKVGTTLKFFVYIKFSLFDGITVQCRHVRKDLEQKIIKSSFEFPPHRELVIMLYQQNDKYQQFQIINNFPIEFQLEVLNSENDNVNNESDGAKVHKMLPSSKYFLMRGKSEDPLVLKVKEHDWEQYPLKIKTSSFHTKNEAVKLKYDESKWEVGIPKLVEVTPNTFPIIEDDDPDWIVSSDLVGANHIFVPRSPGVHQFPQFIVNNQATDCEPGSVEIFPSDTPTYVPM